jgi:hypothetical protein
LGFVIFIFILSEENTKGAMGLMIKFTLVMMPFQNFWAIFHRTLTEKTVRQMEAIVV